MNWPQNLPSFSTFSTAGFGALPSYTIRPFNVPWADASCARVATINSAMIKFDRFIIFPYSRFSDADLQLTVAVLPYELKRIDGKLLWLSPLWLSSTSHTESY